MLTGAMFLPLVVTISFFLRPGTHAGRYKPEGSRRRARLAQLSGFAAWSGLRAAHGSASLLARAPCGDHRVRTTHTETRFEGPGLLDATAARTGRASRKVTIRRRSSS
jgi:hypothetical protein